MAANGGEVVTKGSTSERRGTSRSLQEIARNAVKARILSGELTPGSALSEETVATELEMSRTPVRHAFLDLAALGLLERIPGRGAIVSRVDLDKMLDVVDVQLCLLEWAVEQLCKLPRDMSAVLNAFDRQLEALKNDDYLEVRIQARLMDIALVTGTGNQLMERYMREISDLVLHGASQSLGTKESYQTAVSEHGEIVESVNAGDVERSKLAVRRHLEGVRRRMLNRTQASV